MWSITTPVFAYLIQGLLKTGHHWSDRRLLSISWKSCHQHWWVYGCRTLDSSKVDNSHQEPNEVAPSFPGTPVQEGKNDSFAFQTQHHHSSLTISSENFQFRPCKLVPSLLNPHTPKTELPVFVQRTAG